MQKITQRAFLLMVILLSINACKTDPKTDTVQNPGSPDFSLVSVKTAESTEDTIVYDEFYFPDDTNFMAKILTVGIFHEDEVWTGADQLKWFGLFYNQSNVYTACMLLAINESMMKTGFGMKSGIIDYSLRPK